MSCACIAIDSDQDHLRRVRNDDMHHTGARGGVMRGVLLWDRLHCDSSMTMVVKSCSFRPDWRAHSAHPPTTQPLLLRQVYAVLLDDFSPSTADILKWMARPVPFSRVIDLLGLHKVSVMVGKIPDPD